jgi:hypothetical protein
MDRSIPTAIKAMGIAPCFVTTQPMWWRTTRDITTAISAREKRGLKRRFLSKSE